MAEKNSELDVINHLLEVEKDASNLIDEALVEADKRIGEAKAKYNSEYKARYELVVAEKEESYHKRINEISENHIKEIETYKKTLEQKTQNTEVFNETLEKLLFAE